jgi:hypothetical protein
MLRAGRTYPEHQAFLRQLSVTHEMQVRVLLLTLSGTEVADLTSRLLDGQVDIDSTAETTRSLDLSLNDPDHVLHLDSRGLGDGALFLDRLISVIYGVFVPSLNRWVEVPIFRGPIIALARDDTTLKVNCLGMEHLAKGNAWLPMTFGKGHDVVRTIKAILTERAGEKRFNFPPSGGRLPAPLSLGRMTQPWAASRKLAKSINRQLYYDGSGTCCLRPFPKAVAWTFKSGDGGTVLTLPDVTYDLSSVINTVWVRGKKGTTKKPQITATAYPARDHPLSPWALGRNDHPRYLVEAIDNDAIRSHAEAKEQADDRLGAVLREGVDVTFDAIPVPNLDPYDVLALSTPSASLTFKVGRISIPLSHSEAMSVGANRRVSPNRKRVRGR